MKPRSDRLRRLGAALALTLLAGTAAAEDLPRVVSVNVCTDQLVQLLADPGQVASLSALARDPTASAMAAGAAAFAQNGHRAEEIVTQRPDIVLAYAYSDPALLDLLRRVGLRVEQFDIVTRLSDIPAQLRRAGAVLGQADRAEAMAAGIEARLADRAPPAADAPVAAFFYPNGYSLGTGTLAHDILTAAGARNLAVALGREGGGRLSVEEVVLNTPDLLIGAARYDGFSRSEEMARHPALDGIPMLFSGPDWTCGTPHALDAVDRLAAEIAALAE